MLPVEGLSQREPAKVMALDAGEFIRRFLVHVLPKDFQRIRYYGFLGNRYRKQKLARCRELLGMQQSDRPPKPKEGRDYRDKVEELTGVSLRECPFAVKGRWCASRCSRPLRRKTHLFRTLHDGRAFPIIDHCSFYLLR